MLNHICSYFVIYYIASAMIISLSLSHSEQGDRERTMNEQNLAQTS